MGARGRTAVLKKDSFPAIPNLEPWDGKDGEVSGWDGLGSGVGARREASEIQELVPLVSMLAAIRISL